MKYNWSSSIFWNLEVQFPMIIIFESKDKQITNKVAFSKRKQILQIKEFYIININDNYIWIIINVKCGQPDKHRGLMVFFFLDHQYLKFIKFWLIKFKLDQILESKLSSFKYIFLIYKTQI